MLAGKHSGSICLMASEQTLRVSSHLKSAFCLTFTNFFIFFHPKVGTRGRCRVFIKALNPEAE